MVTASMYIGKGFGFLVKDKPNVGEFTTAAVDTVSASVKMRPLSS